MYQVYLLRSKKDRSFYIGYTNNIDRRLFEHNQGKVFYTNKAKPWELIYYESFIAIEDARLREKTLKSFGKSFTLLKKRIEASLNR